MTSNKLNELELFRATLPGLRNRQLLSDLLLTLAAALWTGLAGSMLFILLVFLLGGTVQAGEGQGTGYLTLHALDGRRIEDAPLLQTDVRIKVTGPLARVRITQTFKNPGVTWVEGIYQFPLPENSALDAMRMHIGERLLEAEVQENTQARASYEKARSTGHRATLLSQQRPNLFTTAIANIGPGATLRVELEYQQIIRFDMGRFELRLPLVIGPRYIPGIPLAPASSFDASAGGWALATDQVRDADSITPPVADPRNGPINPVSLSILLDAGIELDDLHSPSHSLAYRNDPFGRHLLQLADRSVPADRDFVLHWKPSLDQGPKTAVFNEVWEGENYSLLMLVPQLEAAAGLGHAREVVFVVDSSGSMHGASIRQAKAALHLAISRLKPGDRFNLIQFNDKPDALFAEAVPCTRQNLARALAYVEDLRAEGGTEMMPALELALRGARETGRLRQIVFLTDGSVGNEQALFELIRRELGASRLFTIGIGSAPNSHFMRGAAEFGRGSFTYIGNLAEVENRLVGLFEKLENPALTRIRLIWRDAGEVETYPAKVPDLYQGEPLWIAVKTGNLPARLRLEGQLANTPWKQELTLQPGTGDSGIHRLWAREKLKGLMNELSQGAGIDMLRKQIVGLALKHGLVSQFTSLVVVDHAPARAQDSSLLSTRLPTNLPHGWTASGVFGQLPQTATPAALYLMIGLGLLSIALFVLWSAKVKMA